MNTHFRKFAPILLGLFFATVGASQAHAQITQEVRAHLNHSFVIGNTTLPPGDYTFQTEENSELGAMTATSADDKTSVEFVVRQTTADHTPTHSELTFRKYGNVEFLDKIFQSGSKDGAQVTETGRQEMRMAKQQQHSMEHTEIQK